MPNITQHDDGSMGIEGADYAPGAPVFVNIEYDASSVDKVAFIAPRRMRVVSIVGRVETAGTDVGAVTLAVKKAASGTAIGSGTVLHASTFNAKGAAATNQTLTLIEANLDIPAGTAIGIDVVGASVLTAATGCVTVGLRWA